MKYLILLLLLLAACQQQPEPQLIADATAVDCPATCRFSEMAGGVSGTCVISCRFAEDTPTPVPSPTPPPTPTLRPTNTPRPTATATRIPASTAHKGAAFGYVPGGTDQVDFRVNELNSSWQYVWDISGDSYACMMEGYEHIPQLRPDKHPVTPSRQQFAAALCWPNNYLLVFNECEVYRSYGQCGTAPEQAAEWFRDQVIEKYAGLDYQIILGNSNAHNSFTGSRWLDQFVAAYGELPPEVVGIGFHVYPAFDLNGQIGRGNLDRERAANYIAEYEQFITLCQQRAYCRDEALWLTEIGFTRDGRSPCGKTDEASAACLADIYDGVNGFADVERWAVYAGDGRFADLSGGSGAGPITQMGKVFAELE